jgi:hypothetical protein
MGSLMNDMVMMTQTLVEDIMRERDQERLADQVIASNKEHAMHKALQDAQNAETLKKINRN